MRVTDSLAGKMELWESVVDGIESCVLSVVKWKEKLREGELRVCVRVGDKSSDIEEFNITVTLNIGCPIGGNRLYLTHPRLLPLFFHKKRPMATRHVANALKEMYPNVFTRV